MILIILIQMERKIIISIIYSIYSVFINYLFYIYFCCDYYHKYLFTIINYLKETD